MAGIKPIRENLNGYGSWKSVFCKSSAAMIYYSLKIISPGVFLLATCVICAVVSLATGSSWTTAGTVGIALIGVGSGLGIPVKLELPQLTACFQGVEWKA